MISNNPKTSQLSVHAHFYQPSREDPFSGEIHQEAGAAPYHNWNERIFHECYKPNVDVGNFTRCSFNLGPTLADWMRRRYPETYADIARQEALFRQRRGVSNALAQSYFHPIMPLLSLRDKLTQAGWGIAAYQRQFGHAPQGFWLPETAVDTESLEVLVELGIQYTILAPWQSKIPDLDTSRPYRVELPSGRTLVVFFYHAKLSTALSFNPPSSANADAFALQELLPSYSDYTTDDPLILVASDGELYGHHQPFRDMFLARLLDKSAEAAGIINTTPALRLPADIKQLEEIWINENTSWSCHHGIERWRSICPDGPHSTWKAPLRSALEACDAFVDAEYEKACLEMGVDAWQLRDESVAVLLEGTTEASWLKRKFKGKEKDARFDHLALLLRAERDMLRAQASDAWFFEEFNRIEPRNAIRCAAYALWLTRRAGAEDARPQVLPILHKCTSADGKVNGEQMFLDYDARLELTNQ